MPLTPDQIERYKRHILLPEVGGQGQQKLLNASVLVVGAGGLGCPILSCLTAAGVGHIGICDDDTVALSNLQRQTLYTIEDIDKPKVAIAIQRLSPLNPDVTFTAYTERLTDENAEDLISNYNLVIEGVDNFSARYALNDACIAARKPLVSAAIGKFDGQVAVFHGHETDQPCYKCFVPEEPEDFADCELEGVLGAVPGTVGHMAAMEVIKEITGLGPSLTGHLLIYSGLTGETRRVKLLRDPACPAHKGD
ncbi:MAG: HesA/MoeB/ThiF family protein [Aquisalinus sp.]|nr:HesA/MoeB/ThiF family protein [Aquisalinus sp.]